MSRPEIGFLTPLFSLPGQHGIGDIDSLVELIEEVSSRGINLLQVLPLNALAGGETSPYSSISAFANTPLSLSLKKVPYLKDVPEPVPSENVVNYSKAIKIKMAPLRAAFERFQGLATDAQKEDFHSFFESQRFWLEPYAIFHALFEKNQCGFWDWDPSLQSLEGASRWASQNLDEVVFFQFLQWTFYNQWKELRVLARESGIRFLGDLPLYVSKNSADSWASPDSFQKGIHAGVPPDLYSDEGQDWGNPIYAWDQMKEDGFAWWKQRMNWLREFMDVVRIDHFRGIYSYWAVEDGHSPKETRDWTPGPATSLINALGETGIEMIGEDLGYIPQEVENWLEDVQVPGFRVLIFGFGFYSRVPEYGAHRHSNPSCYPTESLACTSTHDSESLMEFIESIEGEERAEFCRFLEEPPGAPIETLRKKCLQKVLESPSRYKVFPLQDVLGEPLRVNLPGTVSESNWSVVFPWKKYREKLEEFYEMIEPKR